MRRKEEKLVISFETTTMALALEASCKKEAVNGRLIPLPVELSAECGLAWCSSELDVEFWKSYLAARDISWKQMRKMMI